LWVTGIPESHPWGGLNLIMFGEERWGPSAKLGTMVDFWSGFFEQVTLVDNEPTSLLSTWTNKISGADYMAKQLDHFQVKECFLYYFHRYKSKVFAIGSFDHFAIVLELNRTPSSYIH